MPQALGAGLGAGDACLLHHFDHARIGVSSEYV
jgi:hypothetical protein